MANDVTIPKNFGPVASIFVPSMLDEADDLSAGITGGFGIVGYRGKVWRTKYRGEETPHMNDDGTPKGVLDVVLINSNKHLSKVFYPNGYVEGSTEPPTCASANGSVPDVGVPAPQCEVCAACPHNQWGSRITESGKKGKACSDSKRAVVVPLDDMVNEVYGGPMLLRVPAASLNDLAAYGNKMKGLGYPYFLIATRIRFDVDSAYPKFVFSPIRPLSDEEAIMARELRADPRVAHILNSSDEATQGATQGEGVFEEQPKPAQAAPKPAPQPAPQPARQAPVARPPARPATPAPVAASPTGRPGGISGGIAGAVANPQRAAPRPAAPPPPPPVEEAEEEYVEEQGGVPESFASELDAQLEGLL